MKAPNFTLPDQRNKLHKLSSYKGRWIIIYFYIKDDTPGCTIEACNFRDNISKIQKKEIILLGISKDTPRSHRDFAHRHRLNFPILSDLTGKVMKAYGAWGATKILGKECEGILRKTYLVDPKGEINKIYEKVVPLTHINEILRNIESLD